MWPKKALLSVLANYLDYIVNFLKLTGDWFIFGTVIGENGDGPVETTCCGIGRTRWEGVGHPGEVWSGMVR